MRKLPELGKIIEGHEERDAIHIAIIPAKLIKEGWPGQSVRLVDRKPGEKFYTVSSTEKDEAAIGVIDPFLRAGYIDAGATVWILLKPNTVTDMRHHWEHPDFEDFEKDLDPSAEETFRYLKYGNSIEWMRQFAAEVDMGYNELLEKLADWSGGDDWIHIGVDTPYDKIDKMWECYEHITGRKAPKSANRQPFSCSC